MAVTVEFPLLARRANLAGGMTFARIRAAPEDGGVGRRRISIRWWSPKGGDLMTYRMVGLFAALAAFALILGSVSVAADKKNTHTGQLGSVTGNDFTMTAKGKEHKHTLAVDAKV